MLAKTTRGTVDCVDFFTAIAQDSIATDDNNTHIYKR